MAAIFKMGMIKSSKDKGLYFWTFILPIIFIVLFISIFTSGTMADNKEEVINKIVPGYTVMFVFFIMISMCYSFLEDRNKGMVARLASTPLSPYAYLMGKWGVYIAIVLIQISGLMLLGKIVYQIPFAQPIYLITTAIILSMTVTSMGVLLSLLIQSSNAGIAVTQIIALGGAVLGGLWMPIEMLPDVIQNIGKFTPQYWTHQAFQEAMAGTLAFSQFLKVCGILLGITITSIILALIRYPRFLRKAKN